MPTQIKEKQKATPKKATASSKSDEKKFMSEKNEQISHQNEHRNYCSLSVPVILSSQKKGKEKTKLCSTRTHHHINTKNHPAKKQNRIKISTQQHVRSCTTTVYVNLSMNTFEK